MGVVEDVADDDADVGCQVVDEEPKGDLSKGGTIDFRPFEVDNDCCRKKCGGDGKNSWVKYPSEILKSWISFS